MFFLGPWPIIKFPEFTPVLTVGRLQYRKELELAFPILVLPCVFYVNSFFVFFAKTTLSFINRPLQTGYGRNGVHELGNGPKLSIGDLGLPQIPVETEFYVLDLEIS